MNMVMKRWNWLLGAILLLCTFSAGYFLRPAISCKGCGVGGDSALPAHPGPWGMLYYTPLSISAPDELLPVRSLEARAPRWQFNGLTAGELTHTLMAFGLTAEECGRILNPANIQLLKGGVVVTPRREDVIALNPQVRREVYKYLARFQENAINYAFIPAEVAEQRMANCGVSPATIALTRQWSCPYGRYLIYFSFPCMLSSIPDYEDKVRLMKAMSMQSTYLLRLHITPQTDINALHGYWGRACWALDTKAFMRALADVQGGTWLDIVELLPPLPTSLLYTYPLPQNQLNGTMVRRDCHWTALNFFRDPPDDRYGNPDFVLQKLKTDFFPVPADPRYGDLVLFALPDGRIIHTALYLADNFVYSKNGDTELHPWLISTVADLLEQYSFQVPPDQKLTTVYYRNKYY